LKKVKTKIAAPVKSQKGIEVKYKKQLNKLGKALIIAVKEQVLVYLKVNQPTYVVDGVVSIIAENKLKFISDSFNLDGEYELWDEYKEHVDSLLKKSYKNIGQSPIRDGIGDQLGVIFRRLNGLFTGNATASFAQVAASQMVAKVGIANKNKFDRTVARATGVDLSSIITSEGLEDFTALSISKNASLIKSLPEEYLKQVETIVNNGVVSGARYETIAKEITAKTGANSKLANRIKTIARNEVQTINSQITLRRSESLGIKKGIYRTSKDERVRKCHDELDGVEFEIKKGAWSKSCSKFIQPGITDINCRCTYSPVIEVK
jgi:SPP1 gp7 family putative phage head morphogenesis protein